MKLLRIALSIAIFTSFPTGIIQAKEAPTATQQYSAQERAFIQKAFYMSVMSVQQIDQIIGELALLVSKHQIKGLKSPDHILRIFTEDRQLLGGLLQAVTSAKEPDLVLSIPPSCM